MIFVKPVSAVCPVCVVAVGGGLMIAKILGVDDLVASIWIGALVTASAFVFAGKFRLIKLPKPEISWSMIFYGLTVLTLKIQGKIGNPGCQIWGVCKIWLGLTVGTAALLLGAGLSDLMKRKNGGKVLFPFQKVAIPFLLVLTTSLVFYLITC